MAGCIGIIPARRGSKGLPKKNVLELNGKPLICWTIESAIKSKCFEKIVVTTDDPLVTDLARSYDDIAVLNRPPELASDNVPAIDVVLHVLESFQGFEVGILLQPTSPLRTAEDIVAIKAEALNRRSNSAISVAEVTKPPNWMFWRSNSDGVLTKYETGELIPDRNHFKKVYVINGALYYFDVQWLKDFRGFVGDDTYGFVMAQNRSIDIDNAFDFELCQMIMTKETNN